MWRRVGVVTAAPGPGGARVRTRKPSKRGRLAWGRPLRWESANEGLSESPPLLPASVPASLETEGHRSPRLPEPRSREPPPQGCECAPDPKPALHASTCGRRRAAPDPPPAPHRPAPRRTSAHNPRAFPRPAWSMPPAAMNGLGLVLLAALLCSAPASPSWLGTDRTVRGGVGACRSLRESPISVRAHGLWCQDCTLTTNSSHCTPKQCQPSDTVCASVRITDPSSSRKDHSVNKMCASSCDFVKRHFFSDYLMGFINSGILQVDVDCCGTDLCNGGPRAGGGPWALAGALLLSLGPALLWAGP
uniref:UPAR/Ly6 domain-containing protein n=1 Tax=Felis catus TaxID=9685 RepID=A0ABI7VV18_FELCA